MEKQKTSPRLVPDLRKGQRFGKLTVEEEVFDHYVGKKILRAYKCRCDCGSYRTTNIYDLRRGSVISCGCVSAPFKGESKTDIFKKWRGMIGRCEPTAIDAHRYFNRGVRVCQEWVSDFYKFKEWALSNGYKEDLQIDRVDNNKGYCPENCRFVTAIENANNREVTVFVDYKGERMPFRLLCHKRGISCDKASAIVRRLKRGWSVEDAFDIPIRQGNYRRSEK